MVEQTEKKKVKFIEEVQKADFIDSVQMEKNGFRVIYVIINCIPVPIMLKATNSDSLIIPIVIEKSEPIKSIFKKINLYFSDNLQQRGLYFMKDSTKLILSDQNHQIFGCKDE